MAPSDDNDPFLQTLQRDPSDDPFVRCAVERCRGLLHWVEDWPAILQIIEQIWNMKFLEDFGNDYWVFFFFVFFFLCFNIFHVFFFKKQKKQEYFFEI